VLQLWRLQRRVQLWHQVERDQVRDQVMKRTPWVQGTKHHTRGLGRRFWVWDLESWVARSIHKALISWIHMTDTNHESRQGDGWDGGEYTEDGLAHARKKEKPNTRKYLICTLYPSSIWRARGKFPVHKLSMYTPPRTRITTSFPPPTPPSSRR